MQKKKKEKRKIQSENIKLVVIRIKNINTETLVNL
jgi:hypothetical protein